MQKPDLKHILTKLTTPVVVERNSEGNLDVHPLILVTREQDENYLYMRHQGEFEENFFLYLKPKEYRSFARKQLPTGRNVETETLGFEDEQGKVRGAKVSRVSLRPYHEFLEALWDGKINYESDAGIRKLSPVQPIVLHYDLDKLMKK